jgi:LCP family protein required for cell wall assembly
MAAVTYVSNGLGTDVTRKRIILLAAGAVVVLVVAFAGWQGARAWWAWRGIDRIEFNTAEARGQLPPLPDTGNDDVSEPAEDLSPPTTYQTVDYDTVLAIGSDERTDEEKRLYEEAGLPLQEGAHADAILLWLAPTDGGDPALVSIPRDLLVIDPCTGVETKLDRTFAGCGDDVSGPELVALAVEDHTGIAVDHFAAFGFDAFIDVIDSLGGVEVCVDHALREGTTDLLPAGCSTADGATTLAWVRSRQTQEFVDGEWRFVEGVSDQNRTLRQQELMFAMLAKMKTMRSPAALAGIAESVGDSVALSESLSMGDAVAMAWDLRSMPSSRIRRIVIPTEPEVTPDGSFALRAVVPFRELLEG